MILILIGIISAIAALYLMWRFAQHDKAALDSATRILVKWEVNGISYGLAMHGYYIESVPHFFRDVSHELIYIDAYHKEGLNWEVEVYIKDIRQNEENRVYLPLPKENRERVETVVYKIQKKYGLLDG